MNQMVQGDAERVEIRLAGRGGQGLILAGVILAEAAVLYDGKNACQTQSYGAEARGGASKSEVVIATGEIDYPKIICADVLLALSQEACDRYGHDIKPEGLLIVDEMHVTRVPTGEIRVYKMPITRVAEEETGRSITANMVSLGVLAALTGIVSKEALRKTVERRAPTGTAEINLRALEAGFALV